jgi:menaquinol-cytochrome c reductase iron-sulfur subunit
MQCALVGETGRAPGHRRHDIVERAVADKHASNRSKYTADRLIPGAFEGETVTRRRFMTGSANAAGAIAAGAFTLPALAFAIGPVFKNTPHPWETVGTVGEFPEDNYVPVIVTLTPGIGEAGKTTVYMRKFNPTLDTDPADQSTPYIAISTRCAHLGCPVRWVDAAKNFICPCHGGVYDLLGRRIGGPPVRPLDRFYTRVVGQDVQVGARFSVNSELRRFSPRDPAEPLDGIGQYLYPSRVTEQK